MTLRIEQSTYSERLLEGHFLRSRVVQNNEIDELGHVNNLVWVGYVVQLAMAHSRFLGWDVIEKRFPESTWVIYSQEVTYHAPAFEGEELTEETWVSFIKGARCIRQTSIYSKDLLLSAQTTWVWTNRATGRARRIPVELSDRITSSEI